MRYSRQIAIPEISAAGQERLSAGSVFVVGCGALGSVVATYLAAAGVGRIGIADFDTIDISNLQRQVFFHTADAGQKKVLTLARELTALNPEIEIIPHDEFVNPERARVLFADYDIVIDGSDNPPTKYLIADICEDLGLPYIIGAVRGWEGQVMTHLPGRMGYRDLFPESADPEGALPCSLGGVLGPAAATTAVIEAAEAIKYLTGAGSLLTDSLLTFNMLEGFEATRFNLRPPRP